MLSIFFLSLTIGIENYLVDRILVEYFYFQLFQREYSVCFNKDLQKGIFIHDIEKERGEYSNRLKRFITITVAQQSSLHFASLCQLATLITSLI